MNRKKKLILNTCTAILNQLITMICGFILPKLIISAYGSETNGLVSSITQFLAFFSLMDMGVGAVVRSSLYRPLAEHDNESISRVLISSRRFFTRIGLMLCLYSAGLMIYYPTCVSAENGFLPTALLVFAIAFSSIANYMIGIIYAQLLNADQKSYVQLLASALVTVLNTVFGVVLIRFDAPIHIVKLAAALVFLLRPLILRIYVERHYKLNLKLTLTEEPIRQKWNGFIQHIAQYILKHADIVILTMFSTMENVSIYYVYHLVTNGLQQLIEIMCTGVQALFGNMYAKREKENLDTAFSAFELIIHTFVTLVYTVAALLVLPFVTVYTAGADISYISPMFAVLLITANAAYCLRLPYNIMVLAAGHFKETQLSALIEAMLNVVISVVLVYRYGLVGVAFGTLAAMTYRTVYLALYLRKNILNRKFAYFLKHLLTDVLVCAAIVAVCSRFSSDVHTWLGWILLAMKVGVTACVISLLINLVFYRRTMKDSMAFLRRKGRVK